MSTNKLPPILFIAFSYTVSLQAQDWYSEQIEKAYYGLAVDLSGIDFSKSKTDAYRFETWLLDAGQAEMQLRMRNQFQRAIPFEYTPGRADINYLLRVSAKIKEKDAELRFRKLEVTLETTYKSILLKNIGAEKQLLTAQGEKPLKNGAASLEELKTLILDMTQALMNRLDHKALLKPKSRITVPGKAFGHQFSPGLLGDGSLVLNRGRLIFYLNGRKELEIEPNHAFVRPVQTPIFGPVPVVKLSDGQGQPFYFRFVDIATFKEVEKRCDHIKKFIGSK